MPPAALANRDLYGVHGECDGVRMHQGIMENDVGALQQPRRPQREEIRRARAGADEIDGTAHWINPAATVLLVASSTRMKLPVTRLSA